MGSALANDLLDDQLERPWQLVWAAGGERVEHVADGADAPDQGDLLAAQSMWIAGAVPALVMRTGDRLGHLDQRRARAGQQRSSGRRVGLHQLPLGSAEFTALEQDLVGDPDLADVVQGAGDAQALGVFR